MLNLHPLIDEAKCYATVRALRWPAGVRCAPGAARQVTTPGWDTTPPHRQKDRCQGGGRAFDDLPGTGFAGHPQPLRTWMLCLSLRGLTLSNQQIARELGLKTDAVHRLTAPLRHGVVVPPPEPHLAGEVEGDDGSGVAGHQGRPDAVTNKAVVGAGDG